MEQKEEAQQLMLLEVIDSNIEEAAMVELVVVVGKHQYVAEVMKFSADSLNVKTYYVHIYVHTY